MTASLAPDGVGGRHDSGIATLLLLNGPPGIGKTTLARRAVDDRPLALLVDIDGLRCALGGWQDDTRSRVVARDLALALVRSHLGAGHDVVVPQYLGRVEFIDALAAVAADVGASFFEVVLEAPIGALVERFEVRRAELAAAGLEHPEADIDGGSVPDAIEAAVERLRAVAAARLGTVVISAAGDPDETVRALGEVLGRDRAAS